MARPNTYTETHRVGAHSIETVKTVRRELPASVVKAIMRNRERGA
jgi:hypothetical protein